jgi:hypothetical protein
VEGEELQVEGREEEVVARARAFHRLHNALIRHPKVNK